MYEDWPKTHGNGPTRAFLPFLFVGKCYSISIWRVHYLDNGLQMAHTVYLENLHPSPIQTKTLFASKFKQN